MDDLYFGEGLYELESDGRKFRWASECFYLHIFNKNVKSLKLRIFSEVSGLLSVEFNQTTLKSNIERGFKILNIDLDSYSEIVKITQPYFIPSDKFKTTDTRKLSYRIYNVTAIFDSNKQNIYNIEDVKLYEKNTVDLMNKDKNEIIVKSVGQYGEMFININSSNKNGKLNLNIDQTSFYSHRSGWNYVLQNLAEFHNKNGILFDGFLENAFSWKKSEYIKNNIIPYKQPWIGFLHNPPNMPLWFSDNNAYPQSIIHDSYFRDSLNSCKGLYVLSDYYKRFLKYYIPHIAIEVLYHPTEIPDVKFSYEKFINNNNKKIVNIGWWLRKLNSIFLLNAPNKIRLLPNNKCKDTILRLNSIERSLLNLKLTSEQFSSVKMIDHLSNDDYDDLLSENIVFLDLYDTSANNAVVECIARGTPLLINKHPATLEYLGEDYPFYFDNLEEASEKCKDLKLIKDTNEYLMNFDKRKQITIEYFKEQLINSKIYKSL